MHENLNQDKYAANILRTGEMKLFSNLKHVIMVQIGYKQLNWFLKAKYVYIENEYEAYL